MPKKESAKDRAAAKADAAETAKAQAEEDSKWSDGAKSGDKKARVVQTPNWPAYTGSLFPTGHVQ
jgi:hypothetical protein